MDALIGFLGVLIGAVVAGAVSLLGEHFTTKREREARQDERQRVREDRRNKFERETLLALQDAIADMHRAVYDDYQRKMGIMTEHGSWPVRSPGTPLLHENWVDADERLSRLHARVFDDELQEQIKYFRDVSGHAVTAQTQSDADGLAVQTSIRLDEINARVGVLLSRLF